MKVKSSDMAGQFPADVKVQSPALLRLEINNLLGGTEAIVLVDQGHYLITTPERKQLVDQHSENWVGIPLIWAVDLFLGRIPCPGKNEREQTALSQSDDGVLSVETSNEKFIYKLHLWNGRPWPESLHWGRKDNSKDIVDFEFYDPEDITCSPRKWNAVSSLGEVKIRWKNRKIKAIQ